MKKNHKITSQLDNKTFNKQQNEKLIHKANDKMLARLFRGRKTRYVIRRLIFKNLNLNNLIRLSRVIGVIEDLHSGELYLQFIIDLGQLITNIACSLFA